MEIITQPSLDLDVQLAHSEAKIERATRGAFYEVGLELRHIRDHTLYRQHYRTFEAYVSARWGWDDSRARQLIGAAEAVERLQTVTNVTVLPAMESHVRPLLRLGKPEYRAEAWQRAVSTASADGKVITAKIVEAEVERKLAELNKNWLTLTDWQKLSADDQHRALTQVYSDTSGFNETNDNIEWAAHSWNPVTGCQHGCTYCYAKDIANRFYPQHFEPSIIPSRLGMPNRTKIGEPRFTGDTGHRAVFVCSMADLFGAWVPQEWIDAVLAAVRAAPQWTFLFLSKNPRRLAEQDWPENAWVGTTVDRQARTVAAEQAFRNIRASVRFLSCEPLLEQLTFPSLDMFEWVIIGGQSQSTQAPATQPEWSWVRHLENQADAAGCAVYWKPNLTIRRREYPKAMRQQSPEGMAR